MIARRYPRSSYWIVRVIRGHLRLFAAIAVGVAVFLLLPGSLVPGRWPAVTRLLVAWDFGLLCYLAAAVVMMARSSHGDIARHYKDQDEGAAAIMALTVAAAAVSLGAIFIELAAAKDSGSAWPYVLSIGTVVLSWIFLHVIFALHYAYDYYGKGHRACGLEFPNTKDPDYWDFVYFSFVIGTTFQVSDVAISNRWIRRSVAAHGVLSFFFNATVIALTVNMAATAI